MINEREIQRSGHESGFTFNDNNATSFIVRVKNRHW